MATYVIGDVQGCNRTLAALVELIGFEKTRDRIVCVGDLVNRGPGNLEVLRWAVSQGPAVTTVLGNHDFHLLGRARGVYAPKRRDTLEDVLGAPDRDELLAWLRSRPFLIRIGEAGEAGEVGKAGHLIVHAGLPPGLSIHEAQALAAELAAQLQDGEGPQMDALFESARRPMRRLGDARTPLERREAALQGFLLLRTCLADGTPDADFSGPLSELPPGRRPWFEFEPTGPDREGVTVVSGHWAALGIHRGPGILCLDTGCVWGRALTALRLEDGRLFSVPTRDLLPNAGL